MIVCSHPGTSVKQECERSRRSAMEGCVPGEVSGVDGLNLLDFNLFPGITYHRCFRLLDVADPDVAMMEDMEFHFMELRKLSHNIEEMGNTLESWLEFIRHSDTLTEEQMEKLEKQNPAMEKAGKALDEISMDSDTRLQYDRRKSAIYFYERTLDKKFTDGLAEGELKGKLEDARRMLEEGLDMELISRVTGLGLDEVKKLDRN